MLAVLPGMCKGGACPSRARAADRWRLLRLPAGPRHADAVTVSTLCCSTTTKEEPQPSKAGRRPAAGRPGSGRATERPSCLCAAVPDFPHNTYRPDTANKEGSVPC